MDKAVDFLYRYMDTCRLFTFEGSLGSGKTTLIRELLKRYGIQKGVTSPTFNLLNVYENERRQTFYHFDLYRINSVQDFLASGFDEYWNMPNSWVFIEWPEVIDVLLAKKDHCKVKIDYQKTDRRLLQLII